MHSYIKIAAAAVIPALLFYLAVGWMVHLEALKLGLLGLPREMLPRVLDVLKQRGLLVAPLILAGIWGVWSFLLTRMTGLDRRAALSLPPDEEKTP